MRDRTRPSTQLDKQLVPIAKYTTEFPPCGSFKSVLLWCMFNDCACALAETSLLMVQNPYKSCVVLYGTR